MKTLLLEELEGGRKEERKDRREDGGMEGGKEREKVCKCLKPQYITISVSIHSRILTTFQAVDTNVNLCTCIHYPILHHVYLLVTEQTAAEGEVQSCIVVRNVRVRYRVSQLSPPHPTSSPIHQKYKYHHAVCVAVVTREPSSLYMATVL